MTHLDDTAFLCALLIALAFFVGAGLVHGLLRGGR